MTSASALHVSAPSADPLAPLDREIRKALVARATSTEELRLQDGRRTRGGEGPHEYVFTCRRWDFDDPTGFLVRRPGSALAWQPAEAVPAWSGKVLVTTAADLGPRPGDLLLREAAVPAPGASAGPVETADLHRRFGTLLPPAVLAERLRTGVRARIGELAALLATAQGQAAAHDRLARAQDAVDRTRGREEQIAEEVARWEEEVLRARKALERVERGQRRERTPAGPFAALCAAWTGRSRARARELRSALSEALREHAAAVERLTASSGAAALRVHERDRALEATRGLPPARVLAERITRVEHELRRLRLWEGAALPPHRRPLEGCAAASAPGPVRDPRPAGYPSRQGAVRSVSAKGSAAAA